MKLNLTNHAKQRMIQRNVSKNEIESVIENGKIILEKTNSISKVKRFDDVTVVLNWDDSVKTVIKDEKFDTREKANKLANEFKSFYKQASQAWNNGDKALAKELSNMGKKKFEECKNLTDKLKFKSH